MNTMLYLAFTQIVQVRLPMSVLLQIFGDMPGEENVTGITTVHHPLGHVDSGTGDICALVDINHAANRSTVHTHAHAKLRMILECTTDLERAFNRRLRTTVEYQRHPIASRNLYESFRLLRPAEFFRPANDVIERVERCPLLVNQQLRVTNDVHEQDMGNLKLDLFFDLSGHLLARNSAQIRSLHQAMGETAVINDELMLMLMLGQKAESEGQRRQRSENGQRDY